MALHSAGCTQGGQLQDPYLHDLHFHTHGAHLSRSGLMSTCSTSLRFVVDRHEGDLFLPASLWEPLGITEASFFYFWLGPAVAALIEYFIIGIDAPRSFA